MFHIDSHFVFRSVGTPQSLIRPVGAGVPKETWTGEGGSSRPRLWRDAAIIRLLMDTGGRLAEITLLDVDDVDLKRDLVLVRGKGDKQRAIPFGEKTGQALTRYLRARANDAVPRGRPGKHEDKPQAAAKWEESCMGQ